MGGSETAGGEEMCAKGSELELKTRNLRLFVLSPLCDSREKSVDAAQKFLLSFCLEANIVLCSGQNIGGSISSGKHISSRSILSSVFVSVKISSNFLGTRLVWPTTKLV